ncbi:Stig1 domain-containing protein [Cephalotus follicularis]|uniref:Stig1 domain-containing protein n=1 Tax=Cephalotus follicularis TaxID=3775 RepID=A0A1Q3CPF9_CEPFO|nr:Stig1 domain-containing protein [Cephalotus follicularis]
MEVMKIIFTIAITMAITITLTMKRIGQLEQNPPFKQIDTLNTITDKLSSHEMKLNPSIRVSRFLANTEPNAREDGHCHKNNEICYVHTGYKSTCCNNKCMDLSTDKNNCGECKKKCKYTESCCSGKCVDLAFYKSHCGRCNNRCSHGEYCVYGMCDYA